MNKKLIESIAKLAKVTDVEAFTSALMSESDTDFKLDTDNLVIRTKEEDLQLKENIIKEQEPIIWRKATEIQIKDMKKELGLEFEGKKPEDFISNFKSKILSEAKVEPNKKIEELENSLTNLRGQLEQKDNAFSELQSNIQKDKIKFKTQSLFPELNNGLTKDEAVSLFFMKHEVKDDGVYKNGEKLKDNLENALSLEDTVKTFIQEKGWDSNNNPSGRGGGAKSDGKSTELPSNMEEYETYIKEKGWNAGSQEANAVLNEMAKAQAE